MATVPVYVDEHQLPAASAAQLAAWRRELVVLAPRIGSLLKRASKADADVLWQLLVAGDPTANFLDGGPGDLLCEPTHCWACYSALLSTGSSLAPRNDSVLRSTLQLLENLTGEKRQGLDAYLRANQVGLFGPTTAGIAIMIFQSDRVQAELGSLSKLLSPRHPNTLRLMSLAVLSELGVESRPVLPRIEDLLADEDARVRLTAAFTVAAIKREHFDLDRVATQARLQEKDILLLTNATGEYVSEAEEMNKFVCEEIEPEAIRQLLLAAKTNVGKRCILRSAIRLIRHSEAEMSSLRVIIENVLKSDGLEDETRRLALLTRRELIGPLH